MTALVEEDRGLADLDADDPSDLACLFASTGAAYQAFSPTVLPFSPNPSSSSPPSSSFLRRTSRPLSQVASYAEDGRGKEAYETRDLDGKNVYDSVGTDEDFRLPNQLVPVNHECNVLQMTECCPTTCELWGPEGCDNSDFRKGIEVDLEVAEEPGKGQGVRVRKDTKKGTFVREYHGDVLSCGDAFQRAADYAEDHSQMFYIQELGDSARNAQGAQLYVDARDSDCVLKYVNHSCKPNCRMEVWLVEGLQRIALYTTKNLKEGDWLSYDYRTETREDGVMREICRCGAKNCRGYI